MVTLAESRSGNFVHFRNFLSHFDVEMESVLATVAMDSALEAVALEVGEMQARRSVAVQQAFGRMVLARGH